MRKEGSKCRGGGEIQVKCPDRKTWETQGKGFRPRGLWDLLLFRFSSREG